MVDVTERDSADRGEARGPSGRPTEFVSAALHDKAAFDRALEQIVALGVERDSIGVFSGERGVEAFSKRGRKWFPDLSDEHEFIERYQEEMRQGGYVVGVPLKKHSEADRSRVESILREAGAHSFVFGSRWTFITEG